MRFPGFTDEWKTFSLGEKVIIKSGISPQCLCCDGNLPYYKVEQLNHCEKELGETPYYGQTSANNIIPKGSIIFPKRGAAIMTNKVRVNASECILDTNLMALIPDSTLYNHFLFYYVLNRELGKIADTSTIPQINNVHINPLKIAIPIQFEEQRKIGNFLSLLDERIATQNKIIEDLKKLKSAIIDRLYSEVKGVICTYSELFTVVTERNSKRIYNKVIAASQEYGMVERESLNLKVQFDEESINTYKIINSGDYVIHLRSFQGGFAFSRLQGICSPAYIILRPNNRVEYSYFENYFTSAKFINSLRLVTYGIRDGRSINVEEWLSMEVTLPSKEEQKRIIRTIQSIQDKVSNEINILTSLHSQRLFLLRELFI